MKLPRNAKGGLVPPKPGGEPDTLPRSAYGPSYQCPNDQCGHRLTERHWHPTILKRTTRKKAHA